MYVYGANVRHNPLMLARWVRHDLLMARHAGFGGLWAFSEMQRKGRNYDGLLKTVFDPDRYAVLGARTEISLVVDRARWRIHDRKVLLLTHGDSSVPQPNRSLVMALVSPLRSDLEPFWWAGTHWANGGYNGGRWKRHKQERRRLWDAQHAATSTAFASVEESILWTGDVNREYAPPTHPHETVLLEHRIDTLRKIEKPGQTRFHVEATRVLHGQRSDHAPLWATIRLEAAR